MCNNMKYAVFKFFCLFFVLVYSYFCSTIWEWIMDIATLSLKYLSTFLLRTETLQFSHSGNLNYYSMLSNINSVQTATRSTPNPHFMVCRPLGTSLPLGPGLVHVTNRTWQDRGAGLCFPRPHGALQRPPWSLQIAHPGGSLPPCSEDSQAATGQEPTSQHQFNRILPPQVNLQVAAALASISLHPLRPWPRTAQPSHFPIPDQRNCEKLNDYIILSSHYVLEWFSTKQ